MRRLCTYAEHSGTEFGRQYGWRTAERRRERTAPPCVFTRRHCRDSATTKPDLDVLTPPKPFLVVRVMAGRPELLDRTTRWREGGTEINRVDIERKGGKRESNEGKREIGC